MDHCIAVGPKPEMLENELATGQADDGWTMVQPKSATGSRSVVARLGKQTMAIVSAPKQDPDPFTESGNFANQQKNYAATIMTSDHERDQNGQARDWNCSRSRSEIRNYKML